MGNLLFPHEVVMAVREGGRGAVLLRGEVRVGVGEAAREHVMVVDVAAARGEVLAEDLWDGTSELRGPCERPFRARDVDSDGQQDLWCDGRLVLGPFLGSDRDLPEGVEDPWILDDAADIDGDGRPEVLAWAGDDPEETVVVWGAEDGVVGPTTSVDGDGRDVHLVPLLFGPGTAGVVTCGDHGEVARVDPGAAEAPIVGRFYGGRTRYADCVAKPVGDLDGDGFAELTYGPYAELRLASGPFDWIERDEDVPARDWPVVGGVVDRSLGDLDGDGLPELLAHPDDETDGDWVVLWSPHGRPLDVGRGTPLADVGSRQPHADADLDGDGRVDLVGWTGGGFAVWFATDLLAARP
jgi:hypothetical protein